MKQIEFKIPEGYELDKVNSTSDKLVYKQKDDIIYVPDSISMLEAAFSSIMGITFNNNTQLLYLTDSLYCVYPTSRIKPINKIKCKLVACERKDLKAGDIAYMSNNDLDDINYLQYYNLILSNDETICVCNKNIYYDYDEYSYCYKVVKV
jgi:hypothetical protein